MLEIVKIVNGFLSENCYIIHNGIEALIVDPGSEEDKIFVHKDVKRVSSYMARMDLAVTSQGRTVYELASMGVPSIVLAQNEREAEHVFAGIQNGFINLGLGKDTDALTIISTIQWLVSTPNVRKEMRKLQLTKDFSKGHERVLKLILADDDDNDNED